LDAQAFQAETGQADVRVIRDGAAVVIDLGDPTWSVVRVSESGWQLEDRTYVGLLRSASMAALPVPVADPAALGRLRDLLGFKSGQPQREYDFRLIIAWLVGALHPDGPYPVLAIDGEQGSGKSTVCRMLRRLVDPNIADLRRPPRDERDVLASAKASRIVGFDNMPSISADLADALCRLGRCVSVFLTSPSGTNPSRDARLSHNAI
jgi:hypothetical protein